MFTSVNVFVFASFFCGAFAAMALGPAQVDPTHPNMCLDSENNKFYSPGETWQLDYCGISTCSVHNNSGTPRLMVEYASCGVAVVDPPCYLKEDKSKPYPDCCPQPECPEDYSTEQQTEDEAHEDDDEHLNEIDDDEHADSVYNHKYNVKIVDDDVKDASRVAKEELDNASFLKKMDSIPSNINNRHNTKGNHNYFYEHTDEETYGKTLQKRNEEYMQALQDAFLASYPKLRRASPRFDYVDSGEAFKDEHFQWF